MSEETAPTPDRAMKLGAQFYTLRHLTGDRAGFEECLRRVAEIGYSGVQLSAVGCMGGETPEVTAEAARELLDRHGLVCCATHRPWDRLRDHGDAEAGFHRALGCELVGLGFPPDPSDLDSLIPQVEILAREMRARGLRFAYHNHELEFANAGGETYFERLMAVPDLHFILDTYWVWVGGIDPARLLPALEGRVEAVHLKDLLPVGREVRFAPVGEGNLDWDAILPACAEAGTEWLVVEQDETYGRDPFDCLASSFAYVASRI